MSIDKDDRQADRASGPSSQGGDAPRGIGTLNEKPLHEALKQWYAKTGDVFEASVDGFVVDIVRGSLLIEIQTRNFGAMRRKLERLLVDHPVRLVYPIPSEKWITRLSVDVSPMISRRMSPKHGTFEHVFEELIRFPGLLNNPNFSLDLLLIKEEEVRRYDGVRGWRKRGWVTDERRLLEVVEQRTLVTAADVSAFMPPGLAEPFTATELAAAASISRRLAQKMAYCLRLMGCINLVGKRGNSILYTRRNL
jgi:hypothetical protein